MSSHAPKGRALQTARVFVFLLAVTGLAPSAWTQETVVHLDPAQTKVEFSVGSTLHNVHGTFKLRSGEVRFDPGSGKATGAIVVAATSGDTANDGRDKKMHEKVLESDKFPEIVFTPSRVRGKIALQGSSEVEVSGVFRLHGQEHDLTMTMAVEPRAGNQIQATTHFGVPYVKWGLKSPSTFLLKVDDTVDVEIHAAGQMSSETAHN
ncbi:MAG TPA: YceI family protein [Candidatus Limnocylindria bacterium]|nr:YceI family protein [Candidatus Limnocylindria bacterium]